MDARAVTAGSLTAAITRQPNLLVYQYYNTLQTWYYLAIQATAFKV
jgi:hypothetical protein